MDSTAYLLTAVALSSIGLGYFVYGRRQQKASALVAGIVLMGVPYFITNVLVLAATGALLLALPLISDF
ncbi:MAG: hypothetical protein PVH31_10320 [Ectothiorhodospiraceae bacterium]